MIAVEGWHEHTENCIHYRSNRITVRVIHFPNGDYGENYSAKGMWQNNEAMASRGGRVYGLNDRAVSAAAQRNRREKKGWNGTRLVWAHHDKQQDGIYDYVQPNGRITNPLTPKWQGRPVNRLFDPTGWKYDVTIQAHLRVTLYWNNTDESELREWLISVLIELPKLVWSRDLWRHRITPGEANAEHVT